MNIKERLLAGSIFLGILVITRTVFYHFFHNYWFGTVGILSAIVFALFYLSKKNKLGYVGKILYNQIYAKIHGKTFRTLLIQTIFAIYLFGMFTIGGTHADQNTVQSYTTQLAKQNVTDTTTLIKGEAKVHIDPFQIPLMILTLIIPNETLFSAIAIINNFSHGWFISFTMLSFVEAIEFLGLLFYFRYKKMEKLSL